jgi:phage terminase large subunit-like protein
MRVMKMKIEQYPIHQLSNRDLLLFDETICKNPYIPYKPYPRQSWPIFEANKELVNNKPNMVLVGAGGFGGKTYLGSMLAAQYLEEPDYSCLVTRLNYAELTGEDSIWENLTEWICDEERLGDRACESNESKLRITAPSGAKIWFKAFDQVKKRQKVKSESYNRIVNDEASELAETVLRFLFRSLRGPVDSRIPLGMINLSNPGGPSTRYLTTTYVDGEQSYFPLDWRHNPYIDRVLYPNTLKNLSYADQQYQLHGDWHYIPESGDIFNHEMIDNNTITTQEYEEIKAEHELKQLIRTWDIAASENKNSDYTAATLFERYNGPIDIAITQTSFRLKPGPLEYKMESIMAADPNGTEQWIERQPAAAGKIMTREWGNRFKPYNVRFIPVYKNKIQRAGKLIPKLNERELLFLKDEWLDVFKRQAVNFPNFDKLTDEDEEILHDDRVDSVSLLYGKPKTVLKPRKRRR